MEIRIQTDPEWIKEFQEKEYSILSVVLNASLNTHIKRLVHRRCRSEVEYHYKKFHNEVKSNFSKRAGVEEISIDTDEKEINQIGGEIVAAVKILAFQAWASTCDLISFASQS